jgi:hypothetical protein
MDRALLFGAVPLESSSLSGCSPAQRSLCLARLARKAGAGALERSMGGAPINAPGRSVAANITRLDPSSA